VSDSAQRGAIAIVGIGETDQGRLTGRDSWDLLADASVRAISDSGIDKNTIDGVITCGSLVVPHARQHLRLADMLGLPLRTFNETSALGGSSGAASLRLALAVVEAGLATTVLVASADNLLSASSGRRDERGSRSDALQRMMSIHDLEFIEPYGNIPAANMAMIARRHMHEFGWTREQFAHVPVAAREYAAATPGAVMTKPIAPDDVLAAPMVSDPFGRLDCSIVSDGGVAYIVTSADRAKDAAKPPVHVLGVSSIFSTYFTPSFPDVVDYPRSMIRTTSDAALAKAGVDRSAVDVVSVPDVFSGVVPIVLDHAGFCEPGEGGAFVASGAIARGGSLPVNTHGGNLAYTHPGNPGQMFNVVEMVKQLRGDQGDRQVKDAELAFVHSFGGTFAQHTSVVLSNRL
jgi:acetyl-CoA acetyltransferase